VIYTPPNIISPAYTVTALQFPIILPGMVWIDQPQTLPVREFR
jgi:hypothetical protein